MGSQITLEQIAVNRYAPAASSSINLYSTSLEGGSGLTLGQLAIAVSLRSAAVCEAQSVNKMNKMSDGSAVLGKTSEYMAALADDTLRDWPTARTYLVNVAGVDANDLPETVETYVKRMKAIGAIKAKVDALTQQQQQTMIDLQTLVNRRDVAYATSSNIVKTLGTSMRGDAENF